MLIKQISFLQRSLLPKIFFYCLMFSVIQTDADSHSQNFSIRSKVARSCNNLHYRTKKHETPDIKHEFCSRLSQFSRHSNRFSPIAKDHFQSCSTNNLLSLSADFDRNVAKRQSARYAVGKRRKKSLKLETERNFSQRISKRRKINRNKSPKSETI